jgi:hypothetical protein
VHIYINSHPRRTIFFVATLGAVARIAFFGHGLFVLDAEFVPDDAYYTLAIARSIAWGAGPSADGISLTNGFQPLLALLEVPAFLLGNLRENPFGPLAWALSLGVAADIGVIILLFYFVKSMLSPWPAFWAALLWSISPLAIGNALGGLETSLALVCELGLLVGWMAYRRSPTSLRAVVLGWLAATSISARVDAVFLVFFTGIVFILEKPSWRHLVVAIISAMVVLAPWWTYQIYHFGTFIPLSGQAVLEQVKYHQHLGLQVHQQVAWALGYLVTGGVIDSPAIRDFLFDNPNISNPFAAIFIFMAAWWTIVLCLSARTRPLSVLILFCLTIFFFYSAHVSALWFFRRYLAPAELLACIALAAVIEQLRGQSWGKFTAPFLLVTTCALASFQLFSWLSSDRAGADTGYSGAKGYALPALKILQKAPDNSIIGAFQSGALAYFVGYQKSKHIKVVNLDGVVNSDALAAIRKRTLITYLESSHIAYFADWPLNARAIHYFSVNTMASAVITSVYSAPQQGRGDAFHLYLVNFKPTAD